MQKILFAKWLTLSVALFPALASAAADQADLRASPTRSFDPKFAPARLRVEGTNLFNARGQRILLRGVNIASLEWTTQGEHMTEAFDHAIKVWHATLIRMPLAQDRWFGKTTGQNDAGRLP